MKTKHLHTSINSSKFLKSKLKTEARRERGKYWNLCFWWNVEAYVLSSCVHPSASMCVSGCVYRTWWTEATWHDLLSISAAEHVIHPVCNSLLRFLNGSPLTAFQSLLTLKSIWGCEGMPSLEYLGLMFFILFYKIYLKFVLVCSCMPCVFRSPLNTGHSVKSSQTGDRCSYKDS